MDFLDFEDNRVAEILEQVENGTLTAEEGVIELLDEEDLLQELRANADLVAFFQDHPEAVVACALVRDGEGQSGDTETLEPDKPTRRDRRGGVAAEVLTGDDGACSSVAKACAACAVAFARSSTWRRSGESGCQRPEHPEVNHKVKKKLVNGLEDALKTHSYSGSPKPGTAKNWYSHTSYNQHWHSQT